MTTLRQATEAFVAVYHARPRLVADLADWSLRIELRIAGGGEAVAVRIDHGRVVAIEDPPGAGRADLVVTAAASVLLEVLALRMSPNEPYLFGELLVDGPEAAFLRLDYLVTALCPE